MTGPPVAAGSNGVWTQKTQDDSWRQTVNVSLRQVMRCYNV